MKKYLIGFTAGLLAFGAVALAQQPLAAHPHLLKARDLTRQALAQLQAAKAAGKTEFGGHRDRAERLLQTAIEEMEKAAEYANTHKR
jgi:hypothetical protein